MAEVVITLKPITNRRKAPIAYVDKHITGVDELRIFAGSLFDVPNVWELMAARIVLSTDATVANRYLQLRIVSQILTIEDFKGDAVAASSAITHLWMPFGTESATVSAAWAGITGPHPMVIQGDEEYYLISVDTGKAGDTVDCRLKFRWLNWELGMDDPYAISSQQDRWVGYRKV